MSDTSQKLKFIIERRKWQNSLNDWKTLQEALWDLNEFEEFLKENPDIDKKYRNYMMKKLVELTEELNLYEHEFADVKK